MIPALRTEEEMVDGCMKEYNQDNNSIIYTKNDDEARKAIFGLAAEHFRKAAELSIEYAEATGNGTRHIGPTHRCHDHLLGIQRHQEIAMLFAFLAGGSDNFLVQRFESVDEEHPLGKYVTYNIGDENIKELFLIDLRKYFDKHKGEITKELEKRTSLLNKSEDITKVFDLMEKQFNYEYEPFKGIKNVISDKGLDDKVEGIVTSFISGKFDDLFELYYILPEIA